VRNFKLVIEGVEGKDPVPHPVSYEFDSEEKAVEAEKTAKEAGLLCFLVTPVTWKE